MLPAMRAVMQTLYLVRRFLLAKLRIRTRGVRVMLFNAAGELLLVRHSYGNSRLFLLPGGGIGRRETPEAAAAREIREEIGIDPRGLRLVSTHFSTAEGKRDTIFLFAAATDRLPEPDGREVVEALFFALDALPDTASSASRRRVAEHLGQRRADGSW